MVNSCRPSVWRKRLFSKCGSLWRKWRWKWRNKHTHTKRQTYYKQTHKQIRNKAKINKQPSKQTNKKAITGKRKYFSRIWDGKNVFLKNIFYCEYYIANQVWILSSFRLEASSMLRARLYFCGRKIPLK